MHIPLTYSERSATCTQSGGSIVVDVDTRKHVVFTVTANDTLSGTKKGIYRLLFL